MFNMKGLPQAMNAFGQWGLIYRSGSGFGQGTIRHFSAGSPATKEPLVLKTNLNGVTTLTMNNPKRLNGWTKPMMLALFGAMKEAGRDSDTKACVITGIGKYYCAGVSLADTIKPQHPQKLWESIRRDNQRVFDTFLDFPKPILVAANGPAIGASVTSSTLCDGIIALDTATFSTPFARLSIPPEGCSSVHFERIMGKENAHKMLFEGWVPTAEEAKNAGFVMEVVKSDSHHDEAKNQELLVSKAQQIAEQWIQSGKKRSVADDLKAVNAKESKDLATAFLSYGFLNAQYNFLASKNKSSQANIFWVLKTLRPAWSRFLKQ